ncbi:MAG: hypothetical protein K8T89_16385, partial [Planctomycetes bacterium]|nr:hypothetical protein [Planctomycetota bacterium]
MLVRFSCILAALILLAFTITARAESVSVEILEGTFKDGSWDSSAAKSTERYTEPAFGFLEVPGKFSPRGFLLDRSNPYLAIASKKITLPAGEYTFLIRARGASRLIVDDQVVVETPVLKRSPSAHGKVMPQPIVEPGIRYPSIGQQEKRATLKLDGKEHSFRFEFFVGLKDLRPEVGDPAVAFAATGKPFILLGSAIPFTDDGWDQYAALSLSLRQAHDAKLKHDATIEETKFWKQRHEIARHEWKDKPAISVPEVGSKLPVHNTIDRFIGKKLEDKGLTPAALTDDDSFIRR